MPKSQSAPRRGNIRALDIINFPTQNGFAGVGSGNTIQVLVGSDGTNLTASLFDYNLALASNTTTGLGNRISTAQLTVCGPSLYTAQLAVGYVPASANSTSPNNKYIMIENLDLGATQGFSFTAYLDPPPGSSGTGSGGLSQSVLNRCQFCSTPAPAALSVELGDKVKHGTCEGVDQLNRPHLLMHVSGCVWISQEMQLDEELRVRWKLEKTDARTWMLVLEQKDGVLAAYRFKSKAEMECKLPFEMKLEGKQSKDFKKWPKFVKVAAA